MKREGGRGRERERETDFKELPHAIVWAGESKIHGEASRLETQTGVDAAVLQKFFSGKPQFSLLWSSTVG